MSRSSLCQNTGSLLRIGKIKCGYFMHLLRRYISKTLRDVFESLNEFFGGDFPLLKIYIRVGRFFEGTLLRIRSSDSHTTLYCIGTVEQVTISCFLAKFSHLFPSELRMLSEFKLRSLDKFYILYFAHVFHTSQL